MTFLSSATCPASFAQRRSAHPCSHRQSIPDPSSGGGFGGASGGGGPAGAAAGALAEALRCMASASTSMSMRASSAKSSSKITAGGGLAEAAGEGAGAGGCRAGRFAAPPRAFIAEAVDGASAGPRRGEGPSTRIPPGIARAFSPSGFGSTRLGEAVGGAKNGGGFATAPAGGASKRLGLVLEMGARRNSRPASCSRSVHRAGVNMGGAEPPAAPRAAGLSSAYTNAIARLPHPSRRFGADDEPTRSRGARGWLDHGFADASAGITSAHACSERALEPQRARPRPLLWSIRGCHLRVESFVFEPFVSLETFDRRRARTRRV